METIFKMPLDELRRAKIRAYVLGAKATGRRIDQELAERAAPERRFRRWAA